MAELHRGRIPAVLAADTHMQFRTNRLAQLNGSLHQLSYADLIQFSKWIVLKDLGIIVSIQELAGIITGEAVAHLGKIIGTEAEELRLLP